MSTSASSHDEAEAEAASTLRHQLIYNGEVLDIALDSIRSYKEGTQSLAYLDSSVCLAWALFRMLEKWGKGGGGGEEMYVRKKKTKKRGKKGGGEEDGVPDVEVAEEEEDEVVHETMFTFEAFEMVGYFFFLSFVFVVFLLTFFRFRYRNLRTRRSHGHFLLTSRGTRISNPQRTRSGS